MEGILALWKERGMTSHDCVFKLRKILHTKKIGHGGTLDPEVEGILPICIGKATKVIEYMVDSGKEYEGEITLGFSTTTEDAHGEAVEYKAVETCISEENVDHAMQSFLGEITQIPPMYSAVKVNGKKLYEYARNGQEVVRPERKVSIYAFERTSAVHWNQEEKVASFTFRVECGKGTYVRTLAVDLGKKLGYPAHMSMLTRTKACGLDKSQSLTLSEVSERMESNQIAEYLLPIEIGVSEFVRYDIDEELYSKVKNGSRFLKSELPGIDTSGKIAFFYKGKVVSIYQPHPEKDEYIKPVKVLRNDME